MAIAQDKVMVTAEDKKFYEENGYLIVRNVLSKDQVAFLRQRALDIFSSGEWKVCESNTDRTIVDIYKYFPEIMKISLTKTVVGIAKYLIGEEHLVLIPETAIMKGFYPTWHKDTTTPEKYGHTFHLRPDFKVIRCGFYLQDNNEYGGGLSVFAGSHRTPDNLTGEFPERTMIKRIKDRLTPNAEEKDKFINPYGLKLVDIPSHAGDLVFFNFKIVHKGTIPKSKRIADVPESMTKVALFDIFGVNNEPTKLYIDFLKTRPEGLYSFAKNPKKSPEFEEHMKNIGLDVL
jgi:ectoine hydroxylase-related dioxygenase (phytanoyl-CoA dioxygenase family)